MSDDIFRFSVIRGPEELRELHPITVGISPTYDPSDEGAKYPNHALNFLKKTDQNFTTVIQLQDETGVSRDDSLSNILKGSVGLGEVKVRDSFDVFRRSQSHEDQASFFEACRFLTAATMLLERDVALLTFSIAKWLDLHPLQIDFAQLIKPATWLPKQALVRPVGVIDHFVVREKLVGYEMGQVEDIKNYLKGEVKDHSLRFLKVDEEEVTDERQTDEFKSSEVSTQQRATLSASAQNTANSTLGVDARVQTSGQYGPTKVDTNVGFQYSSSSSEARQSASEFVSDVMQKAVEETRQKELKRITRRRRTELEENRQHKVDNVRGTGHIIGIYRWVESVWKAEVFDVGLRMVLELLVPEPAKAILEDARAPKIDKDLPPKPQPPPENLFDTLTESAAAKYAAKYGAEGLVAPPPEWLTVGASFQSSQFKDGITDPRVAGIVVKDLKVPKGYFGKILYVNATYMGSIDSDGSNIIIAAPGAHPEHFDDSVPPGDWRFKNPAIGTGGESGPGLGVTLVRKLHDSLAPEATVPVTIYTEDLRGVAGFAEIRCQRSDETFNNWKLEICEKINAAYRARLSEWEGQKAAKQFTDPPPRKQLDIPALSRQVCIGSLLGKWPSTSGREETDPGITHWPRAGALANQTGQMIEFMEQAFEWQNLQYVAYPYYWTEATSWLPLLDVYDDDPKAQELLRAGAVRYVIPVRLEMTESVSFFLETGLPYMGGAAPTPTEPGYLAIADEIKQSRTAKKKEDKLVETFDYKLPTNLTILQEGGVLPIL